MEQAVNFVDTTKIPRVDTLDDQLDEWVEGRSTHAPPHPATNDEFTCCPDFSCCSPDLLQPPEVRRAFAAARERERERYLMLFLGGLLSGKKVYITNGEHGAAEG